MDETKTLIRELHRPAHKPAHFRKVAVDGIDDTWGLDLADLQRFAAVNDGFKYWFVCEDIFSRYAWIVPLRSKTAEATMAALQTILDEVGGEPPNHIWADLERAWYGKQWGQALRDNGVDLYATYSEVGVAPVERLIRTLKNRLWPLMEEAGTYRWLELLPRVVSEYNDAVHSALGMTPTQARDPRGEVALWHYQYDKPLAAVPKGAPRFHVGEWVRISVVKNVFERGFHANWSDEAYRISRVLLTNPYTYTITARDGEAVDGSFYEAELQHTDVPDAHRPVVTERELALITPPKTPAAKAVRTRAIRKAAPAAVAVAEELAPSRSGRVRRAPARLGE
jgi:hypothetical protein